MGTPSGIEAAGAIHRMSGDRYPRSITAPQLSRRVPVSGG